jgi:hypothetical protein
MDHEIRIELTGAPDLEYHLPNEKDKFGNPIPHRKTATGTDREGKARLMSVIGLMPTVVHGLADGEPHTLIIFEWSASPERQGLRFKEVTIEVSFVANGKRGDAEEEAADLRRRGFNLNYWDPEVVKMVPMGTEWYNQTRRKVGGKSTLEIGFSAGFAPYFSIAPKYTMERNTGAYITDSVKVIGSPFVVGSGRNRNNAVRWTMLENESQQSGVPAYLRTAVLLKRLPNDNGLFLGYVKVTTHISWWEGVMEKKRKLSGEIKLDDPIVFDPDVSEPSPFDDKKKKLDTVDLRAEFKIVSSKPLPPKGDEGNDEEAVEADEDSTAPKAGEGE